MNPEQAIISMEEDAALFGGLREVLSSISSKRNVGVFVAYYGSRHYSTYKQVAAAFLISAPRVQQICAKVMREVRRHLYGRILKKDPSNIWARGARETHRRATLVTDYGRARHLAQTEDWVRETQKRRAMAKAVESEKEYHRKKIRQDYVGRTEVRARVYREIRGRYWWYRNMRELADWTDEQCEEKAKAEILVRNKEALDRVGLVMDERSSED